VTDDRDGGAAPEDDRADAEPSAATDEPTDPPRATDAEADVVLRVPPALRDALREPLGPVRTDVAAALADAGTPLVTVGDIVTQRAEAAGGVPQVAVIDGRTQRGAVEPEVSEAIGDGRRTIAAVNPAGTLSASLARSLTQALEGEPAVVTVDGEEDLATLPAILAAPDGASVWYGQPGEGMVDVTVDDATRERARELLERMDGDQGRLRRLLGLD
jgi:uncharacterized protein (UPF0218 family)